MNVVFGILLVIISVIYLGITLSSTDFSGMNYFNAKLIASVCVGIAVFFISAIKGVNKVPALLSGFATGVILHAFVSFVIEYI